MHNAGSIDVLGTMWMPSGPGATTLRLTDIDVSLYIQPEDGSEITRQDISDYLDRHCGDFADIIDFRANINDTDYHWKSEDHEVTFNDCVHGYDEE